MPNIPVKAHLQAGHFVKASTRRLATRTAVQSLFRSRLTTTLQRTTQLSTRPGRRTVIVQVTRVNRPRIGMSGRDQLRRDPRGKYTHVVFTRGRQRTGGEFFKFGKVRTFTNPTVSSQRRLARVLTKARPGTADARLWGR